MVEVTVYIFRPLVPSAIGLSGHNNLLIFISSFAVAFLETRCMRAQSDSCRRQRARAMQMRHQYDELYVPEYVFSGDLSSTVYTVPGTSSNPIRF